MSAPQFRALVVDDDAISRKTVGLHLEQEGFCCEYAAGAEEALKQLDANAFDLVVTDLCMPRMHGHSLAVEILSRPDRPLVVAHSGIDDPRMTRELIRRGVDDVIYKPSNYAGFAAKVAEWALRRQQCRESNGTMDPGQEQSSAAASGDVVPSSVAAVDMFFSATSESQDFADIVLKIRQDHQLSNAVLAAANRSSHHPDGGEHAANRITDVMVALRRIGLRKVADLALDQLRNVTTAT